MSWSTSELRVRLAPLNRLRLSSKIFYWPFQGGTSFVDLLCFCSVLCLLCPFICALWSPAGKGLTSWLSFVVFNWFCHFPIGILGQVWFLIVSIPDLCTPTYFKGSFPLSVYVLLFSSMLLWSFHVKSFETTDPSKTHCWMLGWIISPWPYKQYSQVGRRRAPGSLLVLLFSANRRFVMRGSR